ncbi:MAG: hypothetical protein K1X71_02210 [Pirellulales bacterium]|nr:hypothetical protein [Pirellulales bacterium]
MHRFARCFPLILGLGLLPAGSLRAEEPVSFKNQIAPLLINKCLACHGEQDPKGEYQIHTFERVLKDGYSGSPVISAGKPDESELLRLIASEEPEERMPKEADPLSPEQVALVRRWIEEGAKYDADDPKATLASIVPPATHPAAPPEYRVALPVTALAFSPDGARLAAAGYHEVTVWNPNDGALLQRIGNIAERVYGLAYSSDGALLAVAAGTPGSLGEVRLFSTADGSLVRHLVSLSDSALDVAFSPDGAKLAACAADRSIRVFDVATGAQEVLIEDHADWVMAIAWSPDGSKLASASRDKTAKVFDAKTGDAIITYPGHAEIVYSVDFNADGTQVLTSGRDKKIHVWSVAEAKLVGDIGGYGQDVLAVDCQGGQIFSCSADHTVRQHALDSRAETRNYAGHADWVYALAYHDGLKRLATGGYDGEVRVWNVADGAPIATFKAAPGLK